MAKSLEIRVFYLVSELLAHALEFLCPLQAAGAVAPCSAQPFSDGFHDLRVGIFGDFHIGASPEKGYIDYEDADITTFLIYKMYIALIFDWNEGQNQVDEQMMARSISKILKSGLRKEGEENVK